MVDLPPAIQYGYVRGEYLKARKDSTADADRLPDGATATGTVVFTPDVTRRVDTMTDGRAVTVLIEPFPARIVDGMLHDETGPGIWLPVGLWNVAIALDGWGAVPPGRIEVTTAHTEAAPLDLSLTPTLQPPPAEGAQWVVPPWASTVITARDQAVDAASTAGRADQFAEYETMSAGAFTFVEEQLDSIDRPTHDGLVDLERLYPFAYTGPVEASFTLPLGTWPTEAGTYIEVADPGDLAPSYRGMVFGKVTVPAGVTLAGTHLHYGKVTDAFYSSGHVVMDAAGFFGIDLSAVPTSARGEWALELRTAGGAPIGGRWPSGPVQTGLTLALRSVSDAVDTVATIPAPASGRATFPYSTPGFKQVALMQGTEILGMSPLITGNVRSYITKPGLPGHGTRFAEQSYAYDQAMALMAAIAEGRHDLAPVLAAGLMRLQTTEGTHTGAFRFSGRQASAQYGDPAYRTGAHALAVHALLAYVQAYPQRAAKAKAAAIAGLTWLYARTATSGVTQGLVLGGFGTYTPDGGGGQTFQAAYPLTWASTEHNIDAYFAYRIAARALGDSTWEDRAATLAGVMMSKLWNATEHRLNQGYQPTGPDTADPLDVHSWGSLFLADVGHIDKALDTMSDSQLAPFRHTVALPNGKTVTGYATSYASPGYPGMQPHVWWEGTYSVAMAMRKLGLHARYHDLMRSANLGQEPDGSFLYVYPADATSDLHPYPSIASTAWAILAKSGGGVFDTGRR